MKKLISIFLCIILFCTTISACNEATNTDSTEDITDKPLRICVDFGDTSPKLVSAEQAVQSTVDTFELYHKAGQGGPEAIETEIIPSSGAARSTALTRIRTEIMAGEGPDVFVSVCPDLTTSAPGLFPFVEKAMAAGYFLPLDDYLEKKAQFIEWNKLEAVIMESGRYDGQQMLLPMAFDLPITYYLQEEADGFEGTTTWDDMISAAEPALAAAVEPVFLGDSYYGDFWLSAVFGDYIDYESDKLLISEEELLRRVAEAKNARANKNISKAPKHYSQTVSKHTFGIGYIKERHTPPHTKGIGYLDDVTMIPIYNTDGGTTACIRAYCAINRNTVQPNNAFFVVDYLLSEGMQRESSIYSAWNDEVMITNTELVKSEATKTQGEELTRVLDQISCVRFWTPLDAELNELMFKAMYKATNDEQLEEYVSEAYVKMQMMLAES